MIFLYPIDRLRLQRGVEHLHALGARPVAEFLVEIGQRITHAAEANDAQRAVMP
jgi:hypothetical protein